MIKLEDEKRAEELTSALYYDLLDKYYLLKLSNGELKANNKSMHYELERYKGNKAPDESFDKGWNLASKRI